MKILFKKILYTLVLSVGLISVSSCADYLDVSDEIADNLSLEDVFENKGYVQKWHANIFNSICAYEFMGGAGEENGFQEFGICCRVKLLLMVVLPIQQ